MKQVKYLIIGNGIAGLTAAKEIRKRDKESTISIITQEKYLTYYRIKLTEALESGIEENKLIIHDENWYRENKIETILGMKVTSIEEKNKKVILQNSEIIKYEKLLLATGSKAFIPPIEGRKKKGVFTLRSLKDLKNIRDYIKDKENVIVIGGGLLGLEAAWALKEQGKNVKVVEFAPYLLPRQLDEQLGKKLESKFRDYGIEIFVPALSKEILGKDHVEGLRLEDARELKADFILISTGIRANISMLENTGIKIGKGIIVDENLKSNIDNIFAAGDVAEFENQIVGLWTTSMEQGKIAGANMTGDTLEYTSIKPFTRLALGDIKVFSAGDIKEYEEAYLEGDKKDQYKRIFTRENKIIGGILFGDLKEMNPLREGIFSHEELDEYLKKLL